MRNKVIGVLFLVIVFCTCISIKFYDSAANSIRMLLDTAFTYHNSDNGTGNGMDSEIVKRMGEINQGILDSLPYKTSMVELNGRLLKTLGVRSYYNSINGINITLEGYNVGRYLQTSTDYEVEQMVSFQDYLSKKGINLLYVSEPAKYIDDSFYQKQFGGQSFINRNTDLFLSRITKAGIDNLDLRTCIVAEGIDPLSLFYKTDHHWTVPASKWAAAKIAEKLNESCGYSIDLDLFDTKRFNSVHYENAWLGEQGKKVASSYIGLDDYTMMEPLYDTSYDVIANDGNVTAEGDFDIFIDKSIYSSEEDYYSANSWHYSYNAYNDNTIHNNNADYGKILILGDSYESSMVPFLSLGVEEIKLVVPRTVSGSIRDFIEDGEYDTVIIAYAQFMIGAHDSESNANYRMFTLE